MIAVPEGLREEEIIPYLRRTGIAERSALSPEERLARSAAACGRIVESSVFASAQTVMIYNSVRGELSLEPLLAHPAAADKRFVYPLCVTRTEMKAYAPGGWQRGVFGIREPVPELSREIEPERIDLVICPCTVFDDMGRRIGMGAGYYDRFLPLCSRAAVIAAAFERQKARMIPARLWDCPMDAVFTERRIYAAKKGRLS